MIAVIGLPTPSEGFGTVSAAIPNETDWDHFALGIETSGYFNFFHPGDS
jgi:hypothetical protein